MARSFPWCVRWVNLVPRHGHWCRPHGLRRMVPPAMARQRITPAARPSLLPLRGDRVAACAQPGAQAASRGLHDGAPGAHLDAAASGARAKAAVRMRRHSLRIGSRWRGQGVGQGSLGPAARRDCPAAARRETLPAGWRRRPPAGKRSRTHGWARPGACPSRPSHTQTCQTPWLCWGSRRGPRDRVAAAPGPGNSCSSSTIKENCGLPVRDEAAYISATEWPCSYRSSDRAGGFSPIRPMRPRNSQNDHGHLVHRRTSLSRVWCGCHAGGRRGRVGDVPCSCPSRVFLRPPRLCYRLA